MFRNFGGVQMAQFPPIIALCYMASQKVYIFFGEAWPKLMCP